MAGRPFSKPIHAKETRNGPPSAVQHLLDLSLLFAYTQSLTSLHLATDIMTWVFPIVNI